VVLPIVHFGHPALRQKGRRIERFTPAIKQLAADMLETMYTENGVGLAAQQVGRPLLLTIIDVRGSDQPSELVVDGQPRDVAAQMPLVLLNPQIRDPQGEQCGTEGCLSFPEINADIRRAATITVHAQDTKGKPFVFTCSGLLARAIQHEFDHLRGVLFVDRMDTATRASLAGRLKRLEKDTRSELKAAKRTRSAAVPA